jgi:hypothetical protein
MVLDGTTLVTPSLAQNPASLMCHMKPLDHLTPNGRHEKCNPGPRAPIFLLGAGLQTPPVAWPKVSRFPHNPETPELFGLFGAGLQTVSRPRPWRDSSPMIRTPAPSQVDARVTRDKQNSKREPTDSHAQDPASGSWTLPHHRPGVGCKSLIQSAR